MIELPANYRTLTREERRDVRNEYVKRQDGKCLYCKESLAEDPPKRILDKPIKWEYFPKGFLDYPVHLQHDHKTDMTEGAVHAYCNAVMWQYHGR